MSLTKSLVLLSPRAAEIDPKLSRNHFWGSNIVMSEDKIREKKNASKKVTRHKLGDGPPGLLWPYIRIQMNQIQSKDSDESNPEGHAEYIQIWRHLP